MRVVVVYTFSFVVGGFGVCRGGGVLFFWVRAVGALLCCWSLPCPSLPGVWLCCLLSAFRLPDLLGFSTFFGSFAGGSCAFFLFGSADTAGCLWQLAEFRQPRYSCVFTQ